MLLLLGELGVDVFGVPKDAPASKNRFLYVDGQLHRLPSTLLQLLLPPRSPLPYLLPLGLKEPFVSRSQASDESIYAFFERRFSTQVAKVLSTAMVRGIFAGDARNLSIKACFPSLWQADQESGSVLVHQLRHKPPKNVHAEALKRDYPELYAMAKTSSVVSMQHGMESLVTALRANLSKRGVQITTDTACTGLDFHDQGVQVRLSNGTTLEGDRVVSAIPAQQLNPLLDHQLPDIPAANVAVVNFAFKDAHLIDQYRGFGYLIPDMQPSTTMEPSMPTPLGVVFDSHASFAQDHVPKTRLTVMMGGSHFDPAACNPSSVAQRAYETLQQHLNIRDEPIASYTSILPNCIPQYTVGHTTKLQQAHHTIQSLGKGRLTVVGASWFSPAVPELILRSSEMMDKLVSTPVTGLEAAL
jgi:oxygen-dependent protoporphyrinogen oxidase